jgi:hypothetical protein
MYFAPFTYSTVRSVQLNWKWPDCVFIFRMSYIWVHWVNGGLLGCVPAELCRTRYRYSALDPAVNLLSQTVHMTVLDSQPFSVAAPCSQVCLALTKSCTFCRPNYSTLRFCLPCGRCYEDSHELWLGEEMDRSVIPSFSYKAWGKLRILQSR